MKLKLTLAKKLAFWFGAILLLMMTNAVFTYTKSEVVRTRQEFSFNVRVPTLEALRCLQRDLNQVQSKGRHVILAASQPARRDEALPLVRSRVHTTSPASAITGA